MGTSWRLENGPEFFMSAASPRLAPVKMPVGRQRPHLHARADALVTPGEGTGPTGGGGLFGRTVS